MARIAVEGRIRGWSIFGARKRVPLLRPGKRVFAIGDIHGRLDLLDRLLARIYEIATNNYAPENALIFLGDYIDRGPDSKGVIDRLLALDVEGWTKIFLRGNHDQSLLDFLADPDLYRVWRNFGAAETLLSYGVIPPRFDDRTAFAKSRDDFIARCPRSHMAFLRNLKDMHEDGGYLFVHAGVRPGIPLDDQTREDLLGIRDEFLSSQRAFGKIIVHGHTPLPAPVRRSNRIGIDTGAYATGRLTAAILENDNCSFVSTGDAREADVA